MKEMGSPRQHQGSESNCFDGTEKHNAMKKKFTPTPCCLIMKDLTPVVLWALPDGADVSGVRRHGDTYVHSQLRR